MGGYRQAMSYSSTRSLIAALHEISVISLLDKIRNHVMIGPGCLHISVISLLDKIRNLVYTCNDWAGCLLIVDWAGLSLQCFKGIYEKMGRAVARPSQLMGPPML